MTWQTGTAKALRGLKPTLLLLTTALHAQTLTGVVDMHAHADPDGAARSIDAIDLAKLAKERGMRGLVLKNHYEPTASQAYLARKVVPDIEIFGGVSLDLSMGGVNPAAVEWMTKVKGGLGKIVWMPTFDAQHDAQPNKRPFAPVAKDGKLLPETVKVIEVVAKNKLILETGHSSPQEAMLLIREAKRQGVELVLVTHAMSNPVNMTVAEMKEAVGLGAYIELVWSRPESPLAAAMAKAIREVGPEHIVLSSDLGQATNPLHPDGLLSLLQYYVKNGITVAEIDAMSKTNPARLLGLK
jgi:hypothetical protein